MLSARRSSATTCERHPGADAGGGEEPAVAETRPELLLLWHALPGAAAFVAGPAPRPDHARRSRSSRSAGSDFDSAELDLLEAGANAILPLPPGPDWDDRLSRLIDVPMRKDVRFPAHFEMLARTGSASEQVSA